MDPWSKDQNSKPLGRPRALAHALLWWYFTLSLKPFAPEFAGRTWGQTAQAAAMHTWFISVLKTTQSVFPWPRGPCFTSLMNRCLQLLNLKLTLLPYPTLVHVHKPHPFKIRLIILQLLKCVVLFINNFLLSLPYLCSETYSLHSLRF